MQWRKSSYSSAYHACVEVATDLPGVAAVRDSKDPAGPVLVFPADEWRAFLHLLRVTQGDASGT
jgi:hypothetical protein